MNDRHVIMATAIALFFGAAAQAQDLAAGEASYADVCANCHGPSGQGMASFPKLTGNTAEYLVERLVQYRAGEQVGANTALMAPNAVDLSDDEIANLAAFLAAQ